MRKLVFLFALAMALPCSAHAQQAENGGSFNSCLRTFYDPDMYNWYSVENNCDEAIAVTVCGVRSGGCGTFDLRPGAHNSNGESRKEVDAHGGMSVYACRKGYIPVDANGRMVARGGQQYRCKPE